ncbi:hypothetical protein [Vampirovibrio sp.]|uniref:hypothetical protein n=1 Tax=Vampirovibrio sp. TaxID=2717857 RepID=UPI0035935F1A
MNPALAYHNEASPVPVTDLLADPITRKKYNLDTPFDDNLLRLNAWGKTKLAAHETLVKLPKTIYHGLRGDSNFTFSNFLNVTSIPYYAGGAVLALSFAAGRAKVDFARQAVGVGLYYLGVLGANKSIDSFYKAKTGVDLNLKFRKANGDVERVFASTDFPRFDLLQGNDYRRMMKRLGVPDDVSDPKREVQDQVRTIISAARADKLILGNILAAVGAGYIARSDAWTSLFKVKDGGWSNLKNIWNFQYKTEGNVVTRLVNTGTHIGSKIADPFKEAFMGTAHQAGLDAQALKKAKYLRYGVWGTAGALVAMIFGHSWMASARSRKPFESPFITNLSPALAPEQSSLTAAIQQQLPGGHVDKLPRKGVFEVAQRMETGQPGVSNDSMPISGPIIPSIPGSWPDNNPAMQSKGGMIVQKSALQFSQQPVQPFSIAPVVSDSLNPNLWYRGGIS